MAYFEEEEAAAKAREEKRKREYEQRKYPPLKTLLEGKLKGVHGIKEAILKRLHITMGYLRITAVKNEEFPTLEEALVILGKAHAGLMFIEEIGTIINNRIGSYVTVFPREAVQLRDLLKQQVNLAERMIHAIALQRIKQEGIYEPKTESESGPSVSD